MEQLLPGPAVGPAFFLDKTGTIFQNPEWRSYMPIFAAVAPKAAHSDTGVEPWPEAFPGVALPNLPRWLAGAPSWRLRPGLG